MNTTNMAWQHHAMVLYVFPALDGVTVIRVPMTKNVDFMDNPVRKSDVVINGNLDFQSQQDIKFAYFTGGPSGIDKSICLFASYSFRDNFPPFVYDTKRFSSDLAVERISPMFEEGEIMSFRKAFTVVCGAFYGLRG